jgi:hypothetical protein
MGAEITKSLWQFFSPSQNISIAYRRYGDRLQVLAKGTFGGSLLGALIMYEPYVRELGLRELDFYSSSTYGLQVYEAVVPAWTASVNLGLVQCHHDWEEKLLLTSTYKQCKLCGVAE